ncbi:MAG: exodeoxyribonuclease VII large subunit [Chloroflexi bacterium]|nr:exodeoxyribonuclease VII large subunit [Chloroflexota bacterium]
MQVIALNDLANIIKDVLGNPLMSDLWVEAEIASFTQPTSGHWYIGLKDGDTTMRAACWRGVNQRLKRPEVGALVHMHGRVDFYTQKGEVQLIIDDIRDVGMSQSQAELERLIAQYQALTRQRPIPRFPRRIGIVTSKTGAALQDVLKTLNHRYPSVEVVLSHTLVQGADAPTAIEAALAALIPEPVDVILVVRGGGATEDLAAFNSEIVAKAILRSPVPVITGIGHEIDYSLADAVADLRAPTPTAAATAAVPDRAELLQHLTNLRYTLDVHMANSCTALEMRVDDASARLQRAAPATRITAARQQLDYAHQRLNRAIDQRLITAQNLVAQRHALLAALDPTAILQRGYAIVRDEQGTIVRSVQVVQPQQPIRIQLHDGTITATTKGTTT